MERRSLSDDSADRNCPSAVFAGVLNNYIISSVCSTLLFYCGFSTAVNKKKYISSHLDFSFLYLFFYKQPLSRQEENGKIMSFVKETLVCQSAGRRLKRMGRWGNRGRGVLMPGYQNHLSYWLQNVLWV